MSERTISSLKDLKAGDTVFVVWHRSAWQIRNGDPVQTSENQIRASTVARAVSWSVGKIA